MNKNDKLKRQRVPGFADVTNMRDKGKIAAVGLQPRRVPIEDHGKEPLPYWSGLSHPSQGCEGIAGIFYPTTISYDFENMAREATFGNVEITINNAHCTVSGQSIFDAAWHHGMSKRHEEKWQQALAYKKAHPEQFERQETWQEAFDRETRKPSYPLDLESALEPGNRVNGKVTTAQDDATAMPVPEYIRGLRIRKQSRRSETMMALDRLMESIGVKERAEGSKEWADVQRIYESAKDGTVPVSRAATRIKYILSAQKSSKRYMDTTQNDVSGKDSVNPEYIYSLVERLADGQPIPPGEKMQAMSALRTYHQREELFELYVFVEAMRRDYDFEPEEIQVLRERFGLGRGDQEYLAPIFVRNPKQAKIRQTDREDASSNPVLLWRIHNEGTDFVSEMYGVRFSEPGDDAHQRPLTEVARFDGSRTGRLVAAGSDYRNNPFDSSHAVEHALEHTRYDPIVTRLEASVKTAQR